MKEAISAKPFLKWAGGKTQLLPSIENILPADIGQKPFTYIEPFAGGGAVFFRILEKFPNIQKAILNDINTDLVNTYITVRDHVENLITILSGWEKEYHTLEGKEEKKKKYYYAKRALFNRRISNPTTQSALFIFLNRTCFNGLYRVNKNNAFNVPMGSYKKPVICNKKNLMAASRILQKTIILNGDFEQTLAHATPPALFYFDPPYKPLSNTANFNSYSKNGFDDNDQIRLARFCQKLEKLDHQWILSNSDVKNADPENGFFDRLYESFHIERVRARRNINANPHKRGELSELLITNYPPPIVQVAQSAAPQPT